MGNKVKRRRGFTDDWIEDEGWLEHLSRNQDWLEQLARRN